MELIILEPAVIFSAILYLHVWLPSAKMVLKRHKIYEPGCKPKSLHGPEDKLHGQADVVASHWDT